MNYSNTITLLLLLFFSTNSFAQQTDPVFKKEEIKEDLLYLYESLKEAHYDVYAYVTEEKLDSIYHKTRRSIDKNSLSLLEITNIFQQLTSAVNNGHTEIDFPISSYMNYAFQGGTLFPLELAFENNQCFIRKNFSLNPDIKIDSKIISINGKSMDEILSKIHPQISAERTYLKNAKLETYSFPRYYWQVFGQKDSFSVHIQEGESIKTYIIKSVSLIEDYEKKRDEILNAKMSLQFFESAAYINPGDFSGHEATYQSFIDSVFVSVNESKTKNLILDLRNNKGGDNSFSDYLVSYIADKPFKWNAQFTIKTSKFLKEHTRAHNDTTDVYFQNILSHKDGEIYDYTFDEYLPQDKQKRFEGDVYVLVNRQSHSQSAVTAAQIQDYDFGTIVGEETAEFPSLHASQFQYTLPNTGINVKVSKGYIVRVNGSKKLEGVLPDIQIQDHLLDDKDEILERLLDKLNK